MKLSKCGEYALRAMIDLGIAQELGRPLLSLSELSANEQIPATFLEQIFFQLRSAGYVATTRGKRGGYALARPLGAVRFGETIRLIDGPLAPIRCVSQMAYERCTCPDETRCGLRMLMLDVRNAIARILDKYTLADVVDITLHRLRRDQMSSPFVSLPGLAPLFTDSPLDSAGSKPPPPRPRMARPLSSGPD